MSIGFVQIPRSLRDDPLWRSLSPEYREIYMAIIFNAVFKESIYDDFGVKVKVMPGQFLMTERDLINECFPPTNDPKKLVKYRSLIRRALEKFEKIGFSTHKLANRKTLHSIMREDILVFFKTCNGPNSAQTRPLNNNVYKEDKEDYEKAMSNTTPPTPKEKISKPAKKDTASFSAKSNKSNFPLKKSEAPLMSTLTSLNLNTDEDTLKYFVRKYSPRIPGCAFFLKYERNRGINITNPGGFFRNCLVGKINILNQQALDHKKFAEEFKEENNWNSLIISEKYLRDDTTGKDLGYGMATHEFLNAFLGMHEFQYAKTGT